MEERIKPRSVGPQCGDPPFKLSQFMLAKSAQDQIVALASAQSLCRGGGPAMRGGALRLVSAPETYLTDSFAPYYPSSQRHIAADAAPD